MMSNLKGRCVGLGDKGYDPSLYAEIDVDFFENPSACQSVTLSPSHSLCTSSNIAAEPTAITITESDQQNIREDETNKMNENNNGNESPKEMEEPGCQIFSTKSLLASLTDLSEKGQEEEGRNATSPSLRDALSPTEIAANPLFRLFDISDTSSDEDESQPHMIANIQHLRPPGGADDSIDEDNYLTDDSNLSDAFTDVTPMSSIACSPMPSPCAPFEEEEEEEEEGAVEEQTNSPWGNRKRDHSDSLVVPVAMRMPMRLDLNSEQQLGTLHLDVTASDMNPGSLSSSFLLTTTTAAATSCSTGGGGCQNQSPNDHHSPNSHSPCQCQSQGQGQGGIMESMLNNYNHSDSQIPMSSSSASSEDTGSGGFCGSSSSMSLSIPSGSGSATMSISGSSGPTTSGPKVFGHMRYNNSKRYKNHTFTKDETRRIERDNQILQRKIMETHKRKGNHFQGGTSGSNHLRIRGHPHHMSGRVRQQQQKRIDYENAILFQKLQSVKPSSEIRAAFPPLSPPTRSNSNCTSNSLAQGTH